MNTVTRCRVRLALAIIGMGLSSLGNLQPADAQIIHISYSPLDQWTQCVSNVLGKPLVLNIVDYGFPCPRNLDELSAQLSGKGLVVQGAKWDLILGKDYTTPFETPPEFWRDVEVGVHFRPRPWKIERSRQPTETELRELGENALRVIRPGVRVVAPIATKREPGAEQPGDHTAKFELEFLFDIHQLFPNGPESIIGILRASAAVLSERLIYGEYRNGKPVFLWDSPAIAGFDDTGVDYYSVRNDRVEDIVVKAVPSCGNRSCAQSLVVFRKDGWELTRQMADECRDGSTCPIEE